MEVVDKSKDGRSHKEIIVKEEQVDPDAEVYLALRINLDGLQNKHARPLASEFDEFLQKKIESGELPSSTNFNIGMKGQLMTDEIKTLLQMRRMIVDAAMDNGDADIAEDILNKL